MSSRGCIRLHGHSTQAPGLMLHGPVLVPLSGNQPVERVEPLPPSLELLENKVHAQAVEIETPSRKPKVGLHSRDIDGRASHDPARRLAAQGPHKSIQTESDIQVRILLDMIIKFEVDIRAGEGVRKDLEKSHVETQGLVVVKQELLSQIQRVNQELKVARADAEKLQDMNAEFDSLMQEHHRLR